MRSRMRRNEVIGDADDDMNQVMRQMNAANGWATYTLTRQNTLTSLEPYWLFLQYLVAISNDGIGSGSTNFG